MPFFIRAADGGPRIPGAQLRAGGDEIVIRRNVDFGIAVQSERGLIVPVVKGAQDQAFWELARS
ncbi:MAG: 2-oxo acid dehydrogenase subunit E2 [Anaerotruncus massiliensis (ex Togo et al. 2019)]